MEKKEINSLKTHVILDAILLAIFIALYFLNVAVSREIAFHLPWDVGAVRGNACEFALGHSWGYNVYMSIYVNNIPIAYILGRLYRHIMNIANYPYIPEFFWVQINCAFFSIAGYFCCLIVKKITKKILPTLSALGLFILLVGISPWKIATYTDAFAIVFPVVGIYLYLVYRNSSKVSVKIPLVILSIAVLMLGGWIKPSVYIMVIAILAIEFVDLFSHGLRKAPYLILEVIIVVAVMMGSKYYQGHIIKETGLDYNKEITASWQHYFRMGLNEDYTGSYNPYDATIFGEFQTSKAERDQVCLERALDRMQERGVIGSIYFWLRKLVMTFNDGMFGWRTEVWIGENYPDNFASNNLTTLRLRSVFWNDGSHQTPYNLVSQVAWFCCLIGFFGCGMGRKEKKDYLFVFVVCFLGLFFYQMLFEARSRYLFCFLPLLIAMAACGIQQLSTILLVHKHDKDA